MVSNGIIAVFGILVIGAVIGNAQNRSQYFEFRKQAESLYRSPTKAELKRIAPDRDLTDKYRRILNAPNTGLTKLLVDSGCADNTKIISASRDCINNSMPGGGSSFSFRIKNYRISRLADITYTINSFQATGAFLHGVFVNLGDVPIDKIDLNTNGLQFLRKYQPPADFKSARSADRVLSRGLISGGFLYRRALFIKENATFALRSIAYRGKYYRSAAGVTYNEFEFDKRRDLIVVFRIVRKHRDESVTLLWKVLVNQKSPKLTIEKNSVSN